MVQAERGPQTASRVAAAASSAAGARIGRSVPAAGAAIAVATTSTGIRSRRRWPVPRGRPSADRSMCWEVQDGRTRRGSEPADQARAVSPYIRRCRAFWLARESSSMKAPNRSSAKCSIRGSVRWRSSASAWRRVSSVCGPISTLDTNAARRALVTRSSGAPRNSISNRLSRWYSNGVGKANRRGCGHTPADDPALPTSLWISSPLRNRSIEPQLPGRCAASRVESRTRCGRSNRNWSITRPSAPIPSSGPIAGSTISNAVERAGSAMSSTRAPLQHDQAVGTLLGLCRCMAGTAQDGEHRHGTRDVSQPAECPVFDHERRLCASRCIAFGVTITAPGTDAERICT